MATYTSSRSAAPRSSAAPAGMQPASDGPFYLVSDAQLHRFAADIVRQTIDAVGAEKEQQPEYRYGIRAICDLFGVSTVTAHIYKNTFLAPAIEQRGRKIRVDVNLAQKLFAQHKNQD